MTEPLHIVARQFAGRRRYPGSRATMRMTKGPAYLLETLYRREQERGLTRKAIGAWQHRLGPGWVVDYTTHGNGLLPRTAMPKD
jgi:hypothetical protein